MLKTSTWLKICLAGTLLGVAALAQPSSAVAPTPWHPELGAIVERIQQAQSEAWPIVSYEVVREYRLFGDKSLVPSTEVVAKVDYLPPDHKSYAIQWRAGSRRGEDVVRRILQHEAQMVVRGKSWSAAAIDEHNYSFSYLGEATLDGKPCYLVGLDPKRKEPELIRGRAWVDQHSYLVRHIEGQMAKNPSWWLKKVDVKLDFADVGGAWLQTGMEAVADVRILGSQTLESQTIEAHVGDLVAQKSQPAAHLSSRRAGHRGVPATVVVPLARRD